MQQSIFDQAERKKQEGIELVYRHADTEWKKAAAQRLFDIINNRKLFTSDDILSYLEREGVVTGDNRAIAALLQAAKRMNLIDHYYILDKNGDKWPIFTTCKRPTRHKAPVRVWRSNLAS